MNDNVQKKKRNSSLELLRIICMILIIAHHYTIHGGYEEFSVSNFSNNVIILQLISIFGKISCNIFILITGYFMVKSKFNLKKVILLICEMFFYSIGIAFILFILKIETFSVKDLIKIFMPIMYGNWFLVNYLILYCLIPFLNKFIHILDKATLKKFIYILLLICSFIPTFAVNSKFEFNNLDIMIVMYFIGAYIGLYFSNKSKKIYNRMSIGFNLILIISVVCFDFIGIIANKDNIIKNATYFSKINSLIAIASSISVFLVFAKNYNFYSKIVNFVSSSVLGIYLFHDNDYIRSIIWEKIYPNVGFLNSNYMVIHIFIKIVCVFAIGLIIDKIRIYIFENTMLKIWNKQEDKILNRLNNVIGKVKSVKKIN